MKRYRKFRSSRFFDHKPLHSKPTRPRRKAIFEPLEPRLLLAADLFLAGAVALDLTLQLDDADSSILQLVDNTDNSILLEQALSETSGVTVLGSTESDRFVVDLDSPLLLENGINFHDFTSDDSDTLVGPNFDSTWNVDGADSGDVEGIVFSGVENLTGAADNQDTFVFSSEGSLSGQLEGGDAGFDTIVLDGTSADVVYDFSGPDSGTIERFPSDLISYSGFEPITTNPSSIPANPTNVTLNYNSPGMITIFGSGGEVTVSGTAAETVTFNNPSGTLEINTSSGIDIINLNALDPAFGANLVINAGGGNDIITVNDVTGSGAFTINGGTGEDSITVHSIGAKQISLAGGGDDDTYRFNNTGSSIGTVAISGTSGVDSIDFTNFNGPITALSETGATGGDGSSIIYAAGTIDNIIGADSKLQLSTSQVNTFLDGLEALSTWAKGLNEYSDLGLSLPIIAGNVEVGVGEAMQIAETIDQIRLRVLNYIKDLGAVTAQNIRDAVHHFSDIVDRLDRAVMGTIKNAAIAASDTFRFYINLNGGGAVTLSDVTGATSVSLLVDAINAKLAVDHPDLVGKVQAVLSEGQVSFQAIGNEFESLAIRGNSVAADILGFKTSYQTVLNTALEGLGDLNINFGSAILAINIGSGGVPEVELHLTPSASRTTNFSIDLGQDAGTKGIQFDANATLAATANFAADLVFRLQLDSTTPTFLFDLNSLTADLAMNAAVNADISIGFLGAHVAGSITMSADPGFNISGNGMTVAQLNAGNIAALSPSFSPSSSLNADLDVTLSSSLNGLTVPGTAKIAITSSDLFTGSRDDVSVVFTDLEEMFKFDNMNSSALAGLLGQLSTWLKSMGNNQLNGINIPFTHSDLGDLLNFQDMISDILLFDDGDSSIAPNKKLVNDLTDALAAAGLSAQLKVEGDGTRLKLVASDPSLSFSVTASGASWLGFGSQSSSGGVITASGVATLPPDPLPDPVPTPGDAVLQVTIDGVTTTVTVNESVLINNQVVGFNNPKLLYGDKSPTFSNAQEFAQRLVEVLSSITGLTVPLSYNSVNSTLSFGIDLDQTLFNANLPLNFNLDLSPIAELSSTASLAINASGSLSLDIGIDLADAEASSLLTVNTALASLQGGEGVEIKTAPSLMSSSDVVSVVDGDKTYYGRFSDDAVFTVHINGASVGTGITVTGTDVEGISGIDASTNQTIIDLVVDVRNAIKGTDLEGRIEVDFSGNRLLFTGGTGVTSFTITASNASAANKLGLDVGVQSSTNYDMLVRTQSGGSAHRVILDDSLDVGDVIEKIVNQTGGSGTIDKTPTTPDAIEGLTFGDIEVAWNEERTGLKLIDLTTDDGNSSTVLAVLTLNGSKAALELRIVGVDGLDDGGDFDGEINGGQIASATPADRFYLENALISADVSVTTPGDVDVSAVFGEFVTIGLSGSGSLNASLEMGLKDPDTGTVGGRVTLAELVRGLDDISSVIQAPKFDGGGSLAFDVELDPNITSLIGLGATPEIIIDIDNPFAVSILTDALSAFELGASSFDIQLDVPGYSPHTLNVSLAALATAGLTTAEEVAGVLNSAIQIAQDLELGSVIPSYVVAEATSAGGIALRLLENTNISNFSVANAVGGAASFLGFDTNPIGALTNTLSDYVADLDFTFSDLGDLLQFQAPEFNFDSIMEALGRLVDFLSDFEQFDFLNSNLPLLDVSVNDVLDFADRLSVAVNEALANPASSIQALEQKLEEALGANTIGLDLVGLDGALGNDLLKLELDLGVAFSEASSFSIPGINVPILGELDLGGSADLVFAGNLDLDLDFGIDLNNPLDIYLFNTTGLSGNISAAAPDLDFRAALGPMGLFIKDGVANISGALDAGFADGSDTLIQLTDFATLASNFEVDMSGLLNINLPTYFPSEFNDIGAFSLNVDVPDWTEFSIDDVTFTLPDFTGISLDDLGLFDSAMLIVDGLDMFLEGLQGIMDGEVFGLDIPFVGEKLSAAGGFIEDFSAQFIDPLRSLMESADDFQRNFTNPSENFISKMLFDLLGDSSLTTKAWSLDLLKPLVADGANPDNPDSPATPNGVEDFITLDTDGETYVQWNFSIGDTYGVGTEIDMDLGIPGLGMEAEGNIGISFDWDLDLGFGLSLDDGFYLDIGDNNELFANVDITLPSSFTGKLAFLQLRAEDYEVYSDHEGTTNLAMAFAVDISNKSDATDTKLAMAEFGNIEFDAGIAAEAVAELMLYLEINTSDLGLTADTAAGIPKVQSEFVLDWSIGSYDVGTPENSTFVSITDIGNAIEDGLHYVAFSHVSLDAGSFLSDVLGPIVSEVKKITEPVQPFIEVVTTPIPVLSDLGPPITLLDIAAAYGDIDPGLIYSIADIISLINRIPDPDDVGALLIDFGDFSIFDSRESTSVGDRILSELWNPGLKTSGEGGLFDSLQSQVGGLDFDSLLSGIDISGSPDSAKSKSTMQALRSGDAGSGFAFPIFEDPSQIFGLLMGEPAVLVTYDMAPLYFEFEWSHFFPIYGPLGVSINIGFDANIDFAFGYDTLGVQEFVEGDFSNPAKLLNGFYISDTDQPSGAFGVDVPEVVLGGELWAAAELNLGVARAGVGGGIFAEIEFDLFDPNHDGKVRLSELLLNIENEVRYGDLIKAPLAVFDVHGELTAKLFAFLKIDLFILEIDETFDITPEITLLEFDIDFERVPVLATELDNGDLVLNMGRFSGDRLVDDLSDNIDMFADIGEEFEIQFLDADTVQVRAMNLGSDAMNWQEYDVTGKIIAYGDEGDDSIVFSGAASPVEYLIEGGVGNDIITLAGTATGNAVIRGGDGIDTITSAGGSDQIWGGRGVDTIYGGGNADIIFGDDGEITTGANANAAALLKFDDQGDFIYGQDGADLLFGGGGNDTIEGGANNDVILGDGGRVVISSKVVSDTNRGSSSGDDKLFGNANTDKLYGGRGDDIMDGGAGTDTLYGEDGDDTIYGGGDVDVIFGADGDDVIWGLRDPAALAGEYDATDATPDAGDTIEGNAGADLIHGNDGDDIIHGNSGADTIYGNDDSDTIYGEGGPDLIYGGHGPDTIDGGADHDIIFGDAGDEDFASDYDNANVNSVVFGNNLPPDSLPEDYNYGTTKSNSYSGTITDMIDTIYSYSGSDFIDGQAGPDVYIVRLQGADNASFINVYDSGIDVAETDYMQIFGTMYDDNFLLRASVSQTGLAFVALLNEAPNTERINYWNLERLMLTGSFGDDHFAVDDIRAETTITGDVGEDSFQVGQLYRSPRDAGSEFAQVEDEDVFHAIETTIGWLSDGINRPMTIYGGVGNDDFTVFHNKAVLSLFGEDGDDTFLIKAFALAGSQEPFRDRTDVSGGAGVDLVQYAMNAPVNIDGGDGFDTVIIIGTEFGDDFVITEDGVYGAGLNVNFVNIESLSVDGAEGDDRFYVQSTSEKFITQIFGGLGSDTFNISGDMPPVISNDLQGHSGVVRHSIEVETSDPMYADTIIDGIAANVYDNEPNPVVVVIEADGNTEIMEGGYTDSYQIVLSKVPTADVYVQVLAPVQTQDQKERKSKLFSIDSTNKVAFTPDHTSITLKFTAADWDTPQIIMVSALNDADPALDYNDDALEGDATGFINHVVTSDIGINGTLSSFMTETLEDGSKETHLYVDSPLFGTSDPEDDDGLRNLGGHLLIITDGAGAGQSLRVKEVISEGHVVLWGEFRSDYLPVGYSSQLTVTKDIEAVRAVTVLVHDDDDASVIIEQTDNSTDLFEAGDTDQVSVRLSRQPVDNVNVSLLSNDGQLEFSDSTLTFTDVNWFTPQWVTVTAMDDSFVEGFHHSLISFNVQSPSLNTAEGDIDTDETAIETMTLTVAEAYVGLEHRPKNSHVTEVWAENLATNLLELRDPSRYEVISNKVVFLTSDGSDYDFLTGNIKVVYDWVKAGYNDLDVKPILTNISDNEVAQVLITETGGATNVVENNASNIGEPWTDSYNVVLTQQPDSDVYVKVTVDMTKASAGKNIYWNKQVIISADPGMAPGSTNNPDGTVTLKFTHDNWDSAQEVSVAATNDTEYDGDDTQYFAPKIHSVSDIQGPLYLFGEGGNGSVVGSDPLMLYYEVNIMEPTDVVNSVSVDGIQMTVNKDSLLEDARELNGNMSLDDSQAIIDLYKQQMTVTIAEGVEEIGQFRQIVDAVDNGTTVTLTLNAAWNLTGGDVSEPFSAITKYAVSHMSPNFFAIEAEQIDYVFIHNEDSPADNTGARAGMLQDSVIDDPSTIGIDFENNGIIEAFATGMDGKWLSGLGMGSENMLIGGYYHPNGITYGDMEVAELNLGDGDDEFTINDTHVRADGFQTWTIINTGRGDDVITTTLNSDQTVISAGSVNGSSEPLGSETFDPDYHYLAADQTFTTDTVSGVDLKGYLVKITGGAGVGQQRLITGNTADTITVDKPWSVALDSTSRFEILGIGLHTGMATQDVVETDNTLTDDTAPFGTVDSLKGHLVEIIDGAGTGALRQIVSNTATTLTVSSIWGADLDETTTYRIYGEQDGQIAVNMQEGADQFYGSASSIPLVVFGGDGVDHIEGGSADDILFGDRGRVEYVNEDGKIVTLLGLARELLDPQYLDAWTANTLTDDDGGFPVQTIDMQGLEGFMLSTPDGKGFGQRALVTTNTVDELTVTPAWDQDLLAVWDGYNPDTDFDPIDPQNNPTKYRISLIPEAQTDGVTRDPSLVIAIDPDVGASDTIIGNSGNDRIFGGADADIIHGNDGADTLFGDHGRLDYTPVEVGGEDGPVRGDFVPASLNRIRTTYDDIGGADTLYGDDNADILLGGYSSDLLFGSSGDDVLMGDNAEILFVPNLDTELEPRDVYIDSIEALSRGTGDSDVIHGDAGSDYIMGGAAGDYLYGDNPTATAGETDGEDIIIGDNGFVDFTPGVAGRLNAYGSSVNLIESTDDVDSSGGNDTIHGNAMGDVIIGGTGGDTIWGDAPTQGGYDGHDLILGDNGTVNFGDDTAYLDSVVSEDSATLGGVDMISGDWGSDTLIGGSAGDTIYGDNATATAGSIDGEDIIVGDNAEIFYAADAYQLTVEGRLYSLGDSTISSVRATDTDEATGGNDAIEGNADDDLIIGGVGGDTIYGDAATQGGYDGHDLILGDNGTVNFGDDPTYLDSVVSEDSATLGGVDMISGDWGSDTLIGGSAGDTIYGDNATATAGSIDGEDIIVGDNAEILYAADAYQLTGEGRLYSLGDSTISSVRTTDTAEATGGDDTIEGNAFSDLIAGGVGHDTLYGDAATQGGYDGADLILGDNGTVDFGADPTYLNSVISEDSATLGGVDMISGDWGSDTLIGGSVGDTIYGDNATATAGSIDGEDIIVGDNAEIFYAADAYQVTGEGRLYSLGDSTISSVRTTDTAEATGGDDTIEGNAFGDLIAGGVGHDTLYGDAPTQGGYDGADLILGDNGTVDFGDDPTYLDSVVSEDSAALSGVDMISGDWGSDTLIGGSAGDTIYGDNATATAGSIDGEDIIVGDNAEILYAADVYQVTGEGRLYSLGDSTISSVRATDTAEATGGDDTIEGNAFGDLIIGGVGGDTIYGDAATQGVHDGADLILGDNGTVDFGDDPTYLDSVVSEDSAALGGVDMISGDWGSDTIIGGSAGDTVYGDNATAASGDNDGEDIIVGDNAEILYAVDAYQGTGAGRLYSLSDSVVASIVTTDTLEATGGDDTLSGNAKTDVVLGGVGGDTIHGDAATEGIYDHADVIIGDNGFIDFTNGADTDPSTLELIQTQDVDLGGVDIIKGNVGDDIIFGGKDGDIIHGNANDDLIVGDFGQMIFTGTSETSTEETFDKVFFNSIARVAEITDNNEGGGDTIYGDADEDILIGGAGSDDIDGDMGDDLIFGDNVSLDRWTGYEDDTSPRYRTLTGSAIYGEVGDNDGETLEDDTHRLIPDLTRTPLWQDWDIDILDHWQMADGSLPDTNTYGHDYIAGGGHNDTIFAQLGDDIVQGDGSIDGKIDGPVAVSAERDSNNLLIVSPSVEAISDGDDYIEGNGGSDVIFGNLGQDDIIGDNSSLFSLDTVDQRRPSGSDLIFGGAGTDIVRNDLGDASLGESDVVIVDPTGHARDADMILGDNGNIYRLVEVTGTSGDPMLDATEYLEFNYDQSTAYEDRGDLRIIPRAAELLDYTPGGPDYGAPVVNEVADFGEFDEIHGESGDDFIYGMTGSDVMFGEGQDDDLIGGYGNDWISGGTGQDGVIGDDGRIYTSRNNGDSALNGEPLNNIDPLLTHDPNPRYADGNVLDEEIATPGGIQSAVINITGELKKSINLTPFSYDAGWSGMDDEYPDSKALYADDIIFGGLGSDFLHGGSGNDAISGAEALDHAYVPDYMSQNGLLDLGYLVAGLSNTNPGDVLGYNIVDVDGAHLNNRFRAGEFALYDEYLPLHKILLNDDGSLWDPETQEAPTNEFLLNFDESEGVARPEGVLSKVTGQQPSGYLAVNDDGQDVIFGDLGNDWLVGGTGRDNLYGGWGNDLLNADDDQTTNGDLNDQPDTHPTYEDRAYGGAGRDVIIGNTGGDRLIDWVGEYNSYLVPYAPFGQASVSRTMQPFLREFLYSLSAGDGADPTRSFDSGSDPLRNGEPEGELGVVIQKDFAWQDQTGAPSDPQAGNIPGGKRDVLRTSSFNDGDVNSNSMYVDSGTFAVDSGKLMVTAESLGGDAVSVYHVDEMLPQYFEIKASITMEKPTGGWKANAYIIYDYYSEIDFKFAGIDASRNKIQMGHRTAEGWIIDAETPSQIKPGKYYNMLVAVNGTNVTVVVDGSEYFTHTYAARIDADGWVYGINAGMVGLGSDNSRGTFDNIAVQVLPPEYTLDVTEDFEDTEVAFLTVPVLGTWEISSGHYIGAPAGSMAISLVDLGANSALQANSVLDIEVNVNTEATTGIIFDYYSAEDFKYAGISSNSDTLVIGHFIDGKWVVDATTDLDVRAGTDYQLALSLKGTTVDVSLKKEGAKNWQAMVGYVFNSVTVDGNFGLLAKEGTASFDSVTVKTDDPAFRDSALMAASSANEKASSETLTEESLAPVVAAAIDRWSVSGLVNDVDLARMAEVDFNIVDLEGLLLGRTDDGTVAIDINAAGHGWFVDTTPEDDTEFMADGSGALIAANDSDAYADMDLLSVVMHELGHVAGYQHSDQGVMHTDLATGERTTALVFDDVSGELSDAVTQRLWQNDPLLQIDHSKWYKVGAMWDPEAEDEWKILI